MGTIIDFLGREEFRVIEELVDDSLYVRQLAEKIGVAPSTVFRVVKKLRKEHIVVIKQNKNKKVVSLDRDNALTKQIVSLLFIYKIVNSTAFGKLKKKTKAIGVYGSVAEGTVDRLSDIDLWVLTEKKFSMFDTGKTRNELSKEIGKEVSIKAYTKEGLEALKQKDKIFSNELEYKSKILYGEISE